MMIRVRVTTRSTKSEIVGEKDGMLYVKLRSLPVEGEANVELIRLLAGYFDCAISRVSIKSGKSSRIKTIVIEQ